MNRRVPLPRGIDANTLPAVDLDQLQHVAAALDDAHEEALEVGCDLGDRLQVRAQRPRGGMEVRDHGIRVSREARQAVHTDRFVRRPKQDGGEPGLGEAGLFWDGSRHRPCASEGGHADFAPRGPLEAELAAYLGGRFDHVSYERVLSGPGLYNLYTFLQERESQPHVAPGDVPGVGAELRRHAPEIEPQEEDD